MSPAGLKLASNAPDGLWDWAQRALALLALVGLSPLLLGMWAAVRLGSPGPFLFRQARRGLGGRPIEVLKVRTLRLDAEQGTALGVRQSDPTVTRVGRVLRELKLDELPQLWNVVRGEMAMVGPRPIPIRLEDELARHIPGFGCRQRVKPGLTNLGQVTVLDNGVGEDLLADWTLRHEAERHYLQHRSWAYDLVLIALTGLFLLRKLGRLAARRVARRPK